MTVIWTKRQTKAVAKLGQDILKMLQSLQLHFDIRASMEEEDGDNGPREHFQPTSGKTAATYIFESFDAFVTQVVIDPYGGRLNQFLTTLVVEQLELPEFISAALKARQPQQLLAPSPTNHTRKNPRKPLTPKKITKP